MKELTCDICKQKVNDLNTIIEDYSKEAGVDEACNKCLHELEEKLYAFRRQQSDERKKYFGKMVAEMQGKEYSPAEQNDDYVWYLSPMLWFIVSGLAFLIFHCCTK
jgi:hypothetical protein